MVRVCIFRPFHRSEPEFCRVVYRELRDFVNLHTHYRVANVTHALDKFPPFPKVSLPYFNLLKKESREKGASVPGKAEFAKLQRESLENYVLRLVRSVVSSSV
jgi:phospholipase D1/2